MRFADKRALIAEELDGPQCFNSIGMDIGQLVTKKNAAYGDSAAKTREILSILYPDSIPAEKYGDALLIIRVLDKINRIAAGDKQAFGENPWLDIAGYGILGVAKDQIGEKI